MRNSLQLFQTAPHGNGRKWSRAGTRTEKHQIRILNPSLVSSLCISFTTILLYCLFLGISITSLRLELAKEEAALTETGSDQPHDMTPVLLIQSGLDLEEQQYVPYHMCCWSDNSLRRVLMKQASSAHTPNECAELEERRNVLRRRLNTWMEARNSYIPPISDDQATSLFTESLHAMSADHLPETVPLRLPSALPASRRKLCPFNLDEIKLRFRLAQAEDSLSELRRLLRITIGLRDYKFKQIGPSQRAGTRACNLVNRFKDKTSRCAERYKVAHNALHTLDPKGEWETCLQQLNDDDIRGPGRGDDESEGFRELSWIWRVTRRYGLGQGSSLEQSGPLTDEELNGCEYMSRCYLNLLIFLCIGLRCEWVKSKARADRWQEEVLLVKEEMRRVLAFLEWKAVWWTEEGARDLDVRPDIADGIRAYAAKQAAINRALARSFEMRWESASKTQG
jgi:hypothetical protein